MKIAQMGQFYDDAYSKLGLPTNFIPHFLDLFTRFQHICRPETGGPLQVLEVGCGAQSLFATIGDEMVKSVTAIDLSSKAIELAQQNGPPDWIQYRCQNLLDMTGQFDLIVDSHFLHCVSDVEERREVLKKVYALLRERGAFIGETMVAHKMLHLESPYYYLEPEKRIYQFINDDPVPIRHIDISIAIEQEFLEAGFKIEYFYIPGPDKFILDKARTHPLKSDPDVLKYILRKK